MKESPPRLRDDPELGSAFQSEILLARRQNLSRLRARVLQATETVPTRPGFRGALLAAGGLAIGTLTAVTVWGVASFSHPADPGTDAAADSNEVLTSPLPPAKEPPLELKLAVPEGDADVGLQQDGAPEPAKPEATPSKIDSKAPVSERRRRPPRRRPKPTGGPVTSAKRVEVGEVEPQKGPMDEPYQRTMAAPRATSGVRATRPDNLAADLADYARGRDALEAGRPGEGATAFRQYLDQHPRGRLRLEARLGLLEALVELKQPRQALAIARELYLDPLARPRRRELGSLIGRLAQLTGDCVVARELARGETSVLIEALGECVSEVR